MNQFSVTEKYYAGTSDTLRSSNTPSSSAVTSSIEVSIASTQALNLLDVMIRLFRGRIQGLQRKADHHQVNQCLKVGFHTVPPKVA